MSALVRVLPAALLALVFAGCQSSSDSGPKEKVYEIKGKIVAVAPDRSTVKLDHEDIPGLMKAMTMDFGVADPKLLDGLAPGDTVQGKLKVESGKYVLTELRKR
jgi:protein SCO1/2